jgi:hypothetical protein
LRVQAGLVVLHRQDVVRASLRLTRELVGYIARAARRQLDTDSTRPWPPPVWPGLAADQRDWGTSRLSGTRMLKRFSPRQ